MSGEILSEMLDFENESSFDDGGQINLDYVAQASDVGVRLDKLASMVFGDFSRGQLQSWIEAGELVVNGECQKPKYRTKQGDVLCLQTVLQAHGVDLPENIAINVVYVDDDVIVVDKPAGLVVHPGAGNQTGTLVNALLYHFPDNAHLPRAGLVHRIDKETSGLLVVARTKVAQMSLTDQLKDKSVYRHYQCIATGVPSDILRHRVIDLPIARHYRERTKMAVRDGGKPAITHIMSATLLGDCHSLLDVRLETGRTHQIRVHLSHLGFALVGDKVYGQQPKAGLLPSVREAVKNFNRQALHAYQLGFLHPSTHKEMTFVSPLPEDLQGLITLLKGE